MMPLPDRWGRTLPFIMLIAGCGCAGAVATQVSPDAGAQAAALYEAATEAQRQGDYPRAIAAYQQLLRVHPESAETRANLGMMYHLSGQYAEAIRALELAVRAKPQLYGANLVLGSDLLHTGQHERACLYLEKAHRLQPKSVEPVLLLAQAYAALKDFRRANRWYQQAIQIDDRNGDSWFGLGTTYLRLAGEMARQLRRVGEGSYFAELLAAESLVERGAYRDAAEVYRKLSGKFPQQSGLRTGLGFCLALEGDPPSLAAATDEFQAELKAHPGHLPARMGLARVALQQNKREESVGQLQTAWDVDPDYVRSNISRLWGGLPPEKLGDFDQWLRGQPRSERNSDVTGFLLPALEDWRPAPAAASAGEVATQQRRPTATPASAQVDPRKLYTHGQYSQCAAVLEPRLSRLLPADLELLAECSYLRGDYRTTFQASHRLLQARPASAAALFWQARAASKLALAALAKAGEIQPESPQIHFMLGQSYMENESYQEAAGEYLKALRARPDYLAARLGLASAYWADGKLDKALGEARAATQQSPDDPVAACLMAELLMARRQYAEAAPYLEKASRSPQVDAPRVHALRSRVLMADGKAAEALAEIQQALPSDIDGSYHYQLAQIYRRLGDPQAAAAALDQSEKIRNVNRDKRSPMPLASDAPATPSPY